ncbi:sigma-54 dependent transcriptional regulator [Celeribacter halophilus]|jgi:two-component system C4-dicarboxylate transport response regulator DctD|uniref:Sigma-54 dependent transcriptional regulator n=1 Tax=Celeribacter halophilus TaxID=576117 RepID=A0AAW7XSC9_9RHOB|nr:sigma-54 dependent transcriptional regulator [Celeribacter halophilus]MBU2888525.1 sigma-54 dependent transcriptional regulator [Celeribacter halophilus]MDO6457258.1 sigma-54 dependent transcriptional regulator [Celeribacter halophilus]MDO6509121.1 sigma-54 dependent transcriptional regulator [Celeribacter halophilus]MDO6722290.1 sigma-54 dependent transcriptional regulator [Celeribacter halophilus]
MPPIDRVLLVDDDSSVREALGQTLELADLRPTLAGSYIEAKDHITRDFAGVVISDIRMPGKDGFALLHYAQSVDAELPVILLTGEGDVPMAVRGISEGAFDFLEKPCAPSDLIAVVEKALKTRALVLENRRLKRQVEQGDAAARLLRGVSALAKRMREEARAVARSAADVLVTGEPGVGTAKMAEVVHLLSAGSMAPFLKYPASAMTEDSLAQAFATAKGGSVFLDEIAGLSSPAQFALLEELEPHDRPRLIAGTYADLSKEVAEGRFSPDLFYRLEAAVIRIPPLRERREDIPVLFRHYVSIACEQSDLPVPEITSDVISNLMAQDWPGNARSLMNAAMRFAMGLTDGEAQEELGLAEQLAQVERSLLIAALQRHHGNATEAAKGLKLPRKTFYDKLARHGVKAEMYR